MTLTLRVRRSPTALESLCLETGNLRMDWEFLKDDVVIVEEYERLAA